ncbi:MAG: hypothetical protein J6U63_04900 [Clostridia bacterium]|nr:hypothetical protein [Clostridia bacterium]
MRELKRSIARHMMELHGIDKINKKKHWKPAKRGKHSSEYQKQNDGRMVSFFSLHWKEYLDPESKLRKNLENGLKREAIRQSRAYGKPVQPQWPVPRW